MSSPSKFYQLYQRYHADQRGGVLIMFAVALPVLLGFIAFSVEFNKHQQIRAEAQGALDQAVLAAASTDPIVPEGEMAQARRQMVRDFFELNLPQDLRSDLVSGGLNAEDITIQEASGGSPLRVSAETSVTFQTSGFGRYLGFDEITMDVAATSRRDTLAVETVLLLSQGGTMCSTMQAPNNSAQVPGDMLYGLDDDFHCRKFARMKHGMVNFIENLEKNSTISNLKVSLIPYAHMVNVTAFNKPIPEEWLVQEDEAFYRDLVNIPRFGNGMPALKHIVPLTERLNVIKNQILDVKNPYFENPDRPQMAAWVRTDMALHAAGLMLDPTRKDRHFGGAYTPQLFPSEGGDARKHIVITADGANLGCCYTNRDGDFTGEDAQYLYLYEPYFKKQRQLCDTLNDAGVMISVILTNVDTSLPAGKKIAQEFAYCATDSETKKTDSCEERFNCDIVNTNKEIKERFDRMSNLYYAPVIER